MKFRLLDVLICPKCKSFPLSLVNYTTDPVEVKRKPKIVLCSKFCGLKGEPPSKIKPNECEICLGKEIVAGELVCPSCGARYGVFKGVPSLTIE